MRWTLRLLLALGVLALLWSGFWFWSAQRLESELDAWIARQEAEGRVIETASRSISGFPLHLRLQAEGPRISDARGARWEAPVLTGEAAVWAPQQLRLSFPGTQRFHPPPDSGLPSIELAAAQGHALVALARDGRVEGLQLRLKGLALVGLFEGSVAADALAVDYGSLAPESQGDAAQEDAASLPYRARLEALELPSASDPPLGRKVALFAASGHLSEPPPPGPPEQAARRWREAGGILELEELALTWGPLDLRGAATLALDSQLRPEGAGTARVAGLEDTIDLLVEQEILDDGLAPILKAGALAASQSDGESGRRVVELPLSAQDGMFHLGPVPLFPLTPLF
ncbi:DUF2125 domain-containing protein [Fodinicurvata sediminis]|uniref:DUF2125 domain-containing protein n=1 Tax=Fodinicurvata sediminis TaxID=1121832 RepID=UPI0003FD0EF7|nr:DUF2125 domain-containing protein [Fodinicurvata sediminis]